MTYLYLFLAIWVFVAVLCALDITLRMLVDDETIERWTDRIFR